MEFWVAIFKGALLFSILRYVDRLTICCVNGSAAYRYSGQLLGEESGEQWKGGEGGLVPFG